MVFQSEVGPNFEVGNGRNSEPGMAFPADGRIVF